MSYTELIWFENGKPSGGIEYKNSWGGHAFIWDSLFEKYLKDPNNPYDSYLNKNEELRKLARKTDIPIFMRAVHAATFDFAIVQKENFKQFAQHLREFVQYFGTRGRVCHLSSWATVIEDCNYEAIGFYGTSVAENFWFTWNEAAEESIPYDLTTSEEHFEVYEYLKEWDEANSQN